MIDGQPQARSRFEAWQTPIAVALCALACVRALVTFEPFPYFGSDPFQSLGPITSLTPTGVLWLDVSAVLLASAAMVLHRAGGRRWHPLLLALGVVGGGMALWWVSGVGRPHGVDQSRLAFSTLAAVWVAVALAHACADARRRAMCLAVLLGVSMMLVTKGLVQVLVEHPDTLAWYRRDPESFLRAQGWEAGSAQARAYERRLGQPEATGWFGLSNVFATVMAASAVGLGTMVVAGWLSPGRVGVSGGDVVPRRSIAGLVVLAAACGLCVLGLVLSRSKGGLAAGVGGTAAIGLIVLGRAWMGTRGKPRSTRLTRVTPPPPHAGEVPRGVRRAERWGDVAPTTSDAPEPTARRRWSQRCIPVSLALALLLAPMAAVVVRGVIGERISELSLLFRWFYMRGASRIIAEHPLLGVGPAGFREAYMLVKPPLAVEDVTSPHCLALDLLAGFGVPAGGAMLAVVVVLAIGAVGSVWRHDSGAAVVTGGRAGGQGAGGVASDTKALALALILVTMAGAMVERALLTPESAAARLGGLALWVSAAWGLLWIGDRSPRALALGACASAAVMLLHSGIEMTPIWPNAQAWFLATLGVIGGVAIGPGRTVGGGDAPPTSSGAGEVGRPKERTRGLASRGWAGTGAIVLFTGAALVMAPWGLLPWEASLRRAWTEASVVGRLRSDLRLLSTDPRLAYDLGISPESVRHELARLVEQPPATSPRDFDAQMSVLVLLASARAEAELGPALRFDHVATLRAYGRIAQHRAGALVELGRTAQAEAVLAQTIERTDPVVRRLNTALAWAHLAALESLRADLLDQLDRGDEARPARARALAGYSWASDLDPNGLFNPVRASRIALVLGDSATAAQWARRALQNDANARLDPLLGLSESERTEMSRNAASVQNP